jgi:hypothetical protein
MGYASWTAEGGGRWCNNSQQDNDDDNSNNNSSKQWDEPIILRFNGKEYTALLRLDIDNQIPEVKISQQQTCQDDVSALLLDNNNNDTEVEVALPVASESRDDLYIQLTKYYQIYKIPKLRIDFSFEVRK